MKKEKSNRYSENYTIGEEGLHARPVSEIVQYVKKVEEDIGFYLSIKGKDSYVNAKNFVDVILLGGSSGKEVEVSAEDTSKRLERKTLEKHVKEIGKIIEK